MSTELEHGKTKVSDYAMRVWIEGKELPPSAYVIEKNVLRILAGYRQPEQLRDLLERQESSILHVKQEIRDKEEMLTILRSHLEEMERCRDEIRAAFAG